MKKILNILVILTIITTTSISIIGCIKKHFERFNDPNISDKIKNWIVAQINSDNNSNIVKYSFNDIFVKSNLKEMAIRLLDTNISKFFYESEEKSRARYTDTIIDINQPELLIKQFINFIEQVALDNLITKYYSGINNSIPLETIISGQGYTPDYQSNGWYVGGSQSYFWIKSNKPNYMKSRKEQGENNFKIINKNAGTNYEDFNILSENDKKIALKLRFKDYYTHIEIPIVIDKIITITYLHQNEIKRYNINNYNNNKNSNLIYLNRNSVLFNNIQSWDTIDGTKWKSYIKMVWELKLNIKELNELFKYKNPLSNIEILNYNLTNDQSVLINTIKKIFNNKKNNIFNNMIKDGVDPIFGISGFKGFVGIDKNKNPNSIFTNINNADLYKQKIIDTITPGIIKSGEGTKPLSYQFISNKKYGSIVLILPIYAIDLMKNMNINYKNNDKNNKELSLIWYGSYNFRGAPNNLDQSWLAQQGGVKCSLSWLYNKKGYLGTHDENGQPIYNKDGTYIDIKKNIKGIILKWIKYTFAQQPNLQKAAKTRLYSLAFDNNSKKIYSQKLYNEISSFIFKEN